MKIVEEIQNNKTVYVGYPTESEEYNALQKISGKYKLGCWYSYNKKQLIEQIEYDINN